MRTSTQLKALIRNLSQKSEIEAEVLLRNFMLERFLERVAVSTYRDSFILKGGMLVAAMVGIDARATMDMDATIKGRTLSENDLMDVIQGIISSPVDDGVEFKLIGIEEIREETEYPSYRVSVSAVFDKTRQTLKIDVTTGDFITPSEINYSFKLMFEDRIISIMAYNLETVLAEKFETVITRGVTNTRMRDFYDIYILTATQPLNADTFKEALANTIKKRATSQQMTDIFGVLDMVAKSPVMADLWGKYSKKYGYAADITWQMATEAIKCLAEKGVR